MGNCTISVKALHGHLMVKITEDFIEDCILSHPEHPSLLCISDTLEKYGIESLAVKVNIEKLYKLPLP